MDIAYDHVQNESYSSPDEAGGASSGERAATAQPTLNTELQDAFNAVTASPWGSRLGGWLSSARKQGESLVADLQKEAADAGTQATTGWSSLREQVVHRTRGLSLGGEAGPEIKVPGEEAVPGAVATEEAGTSTTLTGAEERPESLPADIVKEAGTLVASLRSTAAAKLKDLQKAEDAADERDEGCAGSDVISQNISSNELT